MSSVSILFPIGLFIYSFISLPVCVHASLKKELSSKFLSLRCMQSGLQNVTASLNEPELFQKMSPKTQVGDFKAHLTHKAF